jgi:4-alpha-glucanotransferase
MSAFAARLEKPDRFTSLAEPARRSFARFVRADGEGLYDVIDGPHGDDASIRPNQIFAVSLPHSPLSPQDQASVVQGVQARSSHRIRTALACAGQPGIPSRLWRRRAGA